MLFRVSDDGDGPKNPLPLGDEVVASGNPDRNPDNRLMFLVSIMSDTRSLLYNFKLPPEEEARIAALMKPTEPSTDFSGIWERVASTKYFLTGSFKSAARMAVDCERRCTGCRI